MGRTETDSMTMTWPLGALVAIHASRGPVAELGSFAFAKRCLAVGAEWSDTEA